MNKGFTEIDLQQKLIEMIKKAVEGTVIEIEITGELVKKTIKVYEQHLPYVMSDAEEQDMYPAIIVRLLDSDRQSFQSHRIQRVGIYTAVYTEVLDPSIPHQWLWLVAHRFQYLFETRRVIGNFSLQKPPRVIEPEEIAYPVYAIGMELSFEMPSVSVPTGNEFERMV